MALTFVAASYRGGWKPGQSGNPKGRPAGASLQDLAREHTAEAVKTLVVAMRFKGPQQVPAAIALLDRGWGKPAQHITSEGTDSVHLHLLAALQVQPLEAPQQQPEQQHQALTIDAVPTE